MSYIVVFCTRRQKLGSQTDSCKVLDCSVKRCQERHERRRGIGTARAVPNLGVPGWQSAKLGPSRELQTCWNRTCVSSRGRNAFGSRNSELTQTLLEVELRYLKFGCGEERSQNRKKLARSVFSHPNCMSRGKCLEIREGGRNAGRCETDFACRCEGFFILKAHVWSLRHSMRGSGVSVQMVQFVSWWTKESINQRINHCMNPLTKKSIDQQSEYSNSQVVKQSVDSKPAMQSTPSQSIVPLDRYQWSPCRVRV